MPALSEHRPEAGNDASLRAMSSLEKAVRAGIAASVAGVLVVALAPLDSIVRSAGGVLLLGGWVAAAWSLHRYGRAG